MWSSEVKKLSQPCLRMLTASSNRKNSNTMSFIGDHNGDWMSVSRPISTTLVMITADTTDVNATDSVHRRSDRKSTPTSFMIRMNLRTRIPRKSGSQKLCAWGLSPRWPFVAGSIHRSSTPAQTITKSNKFHLPSTEWRQKENRKCNNLSTTSMMYSTRQVSLEFSRTLTSSSVTSQAAWMYKHMMLKATTSPDSTRNQSDWTKLSGPGSFISSLCSSGVHVG
mmetsp:Transcript_10254/g.24624  ORF Transcript_10254/g.24624 Transcript_10254/m.24624 type:complete len:223 (+) Transcript_10254:1235-1903(+)